METIQSQEKDKDFEIEKILCSIKDSNFDINEVKQKLDMDLDIDISIPYKNGALVKIGDKFYDIRPESRVFNFKDGEKSKKIFVYSESHLKEILNKLQFKAFNISNVDEDSCDSLDSENNYNEIYNIFENKKINTINKDKTNLDKVKEKFNQRIKVKIVNIQDICLNSSFYYPKNKNDKLNCDSLRENIKDLDIFFGNDLSILYVVGPKGISKSLFLLLNCHIKNICEKFPLLYINYRKMISLKYEKKKNIFKKEMVYLFFEENSLISFYNEKAYENIGKKSLLEFIKEFVQYLLDTYKNYFKKQIILVIDDFDEDYKEIKNIIDLITKENNRPKIKLIISGRSEFMYSKQLLYLKEESNKKSVLNREMILYYNIKSNENNDNNEKNLEEEKKFCEKFNFYGIYYSLLNEGKNIEISDLERQYKILPNDYLVYKKNNDKTISFKYCNDIFKLAAKKSIEFSIKSDNFRNIIKESCEEKNRILYGIYEEKLLTLFFVFNKLGLKDLNFKEDNIFEVEEIYKFKDSSYNKIQKNFDKKMPIIITQKNYQGKNYDLLILIPNTISNSYKAYFIQIGVDKTKEQITEIRQDLNENESEYEEGIKKYIDCDISKIELVFIFDIDTQIYSYSKSDFSGAKFCIVNKIIFFLFSIEDLRLYGTFNMEVFFVHDIFEKIKIEKIKYGKKRTYNESKGDFSFLSTEEIYLINNFINDDISNNYQIFDCNDTKIQDLNKHEKNTIYIYYKKNKKNSTYYVINNKYYYIKEGRLENIKKKYVDQKSIFKLKSLTKIADNRSVEPKLKK